VASSYSVQDFLFGCLPPSLPASLHPQTSFASRPGCEGFSSLALAVVTSCPAPAPTHPDCSTSSINCTCLWCMWPHVVATSTICFLLFASYATLNDRHSTQVCFTGSVECWRHQGQFQSEDAGLLAGWSLVQGETKEGINQRSRDEVHNSFFLNASEPCIPSHGTILQNLWTSIWLQEIIGVKDNDEYDIRCHCFSARKLRGVKSRWKWCFSYSSVWKIFVLNTTRCHGPHRETDDKASDEGCAFQILRTLNQK
jgi:hypothetical protein